MIYIYNLCNNALNEKKIHDIQFKSKINLKKYYNKKSNFAVQTWPSNQSHSKYRLLHIYLYPPIVFYV